MNKLRSVIFVPLRGYRPRRKPQKYSGKKKRDAGGVIGKMSEKELYFDADENDFDPEDFDDIEKHESDFSGAGTTYTQHMHDMDIEKEKLKTRIIARKYFKSEDPNFLTWAEKEQIKSLHRKDSVEWTPERLSEAFPALPDTIRRILRAEWQPLTARTVLKYDEKVIENWELFRSKKLQLSPKLEAHLANFKGRKVVAADVKQIAEKFVKHRPVFPDPKATLFTSLVRDFVESKEAPKNAPQISDGHEKKTLKFKDFQNFQDEKVDFNTFVKQTVEQIGDRKNLSVEMELLVEEYKKQRHEEAVEDFGMLKSRMEPITAEKVEENDSEVVGEKGQIFGDRETEVAIPAVEMKAERQEMEMGRWEVPKKVPYEVRQEVPQKVPYEVRHEVPQKVPCEVRQEVPQKVPCEVPQKTPYEVRQKVLQEVPQKVPQEVPQDPTTLGPVEEEKVKVSYVDVPKLNIEEDSPLTGIIEWKKIEVCGGKDYPQFIKIPKQKAKKNITFRVEDRYYDSDGEFLYRVPGLKS